MQNGFIYLDDIVPNARWDAKYSGNDNFVGEPIDGYLVNRVVGSVELAERLKYAAASAKSLGLGLFFWDGYRPVRAVKHFVKWAEKPEDWLTKRKHYPNIDKTDIIPLGFVSEKSGHSRGGTIDLTLYNLKSGELLDMGGIFDFMDTSSHHAAPFIPKQASANRRLLNGIMECCGFRAYENEWWHYTMLNEPYPDTYFDFVID